MVLNDLELGSFEIDSVNMDAFKLKIVDRPDDYIPFVDFNDISVPYSNNPSEKSKNVIENEPLSLTVWGLATNETEKELNRQGLANATYDGFHDFRFAFRPGVIYRGRLANAIRPKRIMAKGVAYEEYNLDLKCKPYKSLADPIKVQVTSGVAFQVVNNTRFSFEPKIYIKGLTGTPTITLTIDGVDYVFTSAVQVTNGSDIVIDCAARVVTLDGQPVRLAYHCPLGFPRISTGTHTVAITTNGVTSIEFDKNEVVL